MFDAILGLLGVTLDKADQSYQRIKKAFIIGLCGIFAISLLRAIIPWSQFTPILIGLTILLAVVFAYRIFRIADMAGITMLGELLELLGITTNRPGPDNVTLRKALRLLLLMFLAILIMGITLALLPMNAHWWLFLAWPTVLLTISLVSIATGGKLVITVAWAKLVLLVGLVVYATFPQIGAQLGINKLNYLLTPAKVAETINVSRENLKKLHDDELQKDAELVAKATKNTPWEKLPAHYQAFLNAGGRKTLREIREEPASPPTCPEGYTKADYSGPFNNGYYDVVLSRLPKGSSIIFNAQYTGINGKSFGRSTSEAKNIVPGTVSLKFSSVPEEGICYKKIKN